MPIRTGSISEGLESSESDMAPTEVFVSPPTHRNSLGETTACNRSSPRVRFSETISEWIKPNKSASFIKRFGTVELNSATLEIFVGTANISASDIFFVNKSSRTLTRPRACNNGNLMPIASRQTLAISSTDTPACKNRSRWRQLRIRRTR